jgi:hypothetical protein
MQDCRSLLAVEAKMTEVASEVVIIILYLIELRWPTCAGCAAINRRETTFLKTFFTL